MSEYRVIAKAKVSKCPFVKTGAKIIIEGPLVNLSETDSLCATALAAINYSLYMMKKAKNPKEFGKDDVYTVQCPDPETGVIFEISRILISSS